MAPAVDVDELAVPHIARVRKVVEQTGDARLDAPRVRARCERLLESLLDVGEFDFVFDRERGSNADVLRERLEILGVGVVAAEHMLVDRLRVGDHAFFGQLCRRLPELVKRLAFERLRLVFSRLGR